MTKLSVNDVIDLIFGKLDKEGELFDALMHTMTEVDSLGWGTSPTMLVELKVPHVVREFIDKMDMPDGVTRGNFETALFTFFVIHGITHVVKSSNPMGGMVETLMNALGAKAIPIDADSGLGRMIKDSLRKAAAEAEDLDRDCSDCDKAEDCPIANIKDEDNAGHC